MTGQALDYHTDAELRALGEQVRDKSIEVTIESEGAQIDRQIHAGTVTVPYIDQDGHYRRGMVGVVVGPCAACRRDVVGSVGLPRTV